MRQKRQSTAIGQFLVGVAIATVSATIIAPLGTKTFDPGLALMGLMAAIALVFVAMYRDRAR